ncbi:hypothetical protein N7470_003796 [Penicillium chermesinum]|nr:hypothetical protein N7470_003796 [Penicillium chermesinum]
MKLLKYSMWLASLAVANAKRPNILFILTDDQGKYVGGIEDMPNLQCRPLLPSRANIWTGRMPHNTNVTDVNPPYGGWPKFVQAGWNDNYLPLWMQDAGYDTYYVGKLWNSITEDNYNDPPVRGFNGSEIMLDPYTYRYYESVFTRNNGAPESYAGNYSTDVIASKAAGFLDDALKGDRPWMLTVAPNARMPTGLSDPSTGATWFGEPESAPRHAKLFPEAQAPRDNSFNTLVKGAVSWHENVPELNKTEVDYIDYFYRCRLRALQAVDDLIGELVDKLEKAGELDNTYVIFSTDNGYHLGQHRLQPGKNCGFETDINVPLIIRGPGTTSGLDGQILPELTAATTSSNKSEHVAIEYWGLAVPEGIYGYNKLRTGPGNSYENNTYKGIRLIADDYSIYYSVWCTNEKEFYNLKDDPHQTVNLAANPNQHANYKVANRELPQIINRLDALMLVLKRCSGDQCRDPWGQLHPKGYVKNLADALDPGFDEFYEKQPKVSFSSCETYYTIDAEGPQKFDVYGGGTEKKWFDFWA